MPIPSHLLALPPLCAALGIQYVVTSPGSRSAALTIAFSEFPGIQTISVRDERVAGYIALGMAQLSQTPVVVLCTSGTAALNLAPAVAEAYFLQVPLLVLTADRPQEWIHQYDGQTIYQDRLFGSHVKKSIQWLPEISKEQAWFSKRTLSESLWLAKQAPAGPVHINVPIREPFYPTHDEYPLPFPAITPIIGPKTKGSLSDHFLNSWLDALWLTQKPLWVAGQQLQEEFSEALGTLAAYMPVVGDCISQLNPSKVLSFQDAWSPFLTEDDAPDWLISSDKSILSKPLKSFLRSNPATHHVHVQASDQWVDPFQSLTEWFAIEPIDLVKAILDRIEKQGAPKVWAAYLNGFSELERQINHFFQEFSWGNTDAQVVRTLLLQCPTEVILHGGNSMPIRYLNLFYGESKGPRIFCNRGTSGIDGSLSTAVGAAWATPEKNHVAILGDVSFWYDSNALWQNNLPPNLKVLVLNNQGGNIFHMIPGPTDQPAFRTFFQTEQNLSIEGLSKSWHFDYVGQKVSKMTNNDWAAFWSSNHFRVWEIFTDPVENQRVMKQWRNELAARL